jgi:hypothetical protein
MVRKKKEPADRSCRTLPIEASLSVPDKFFKCKWGSELVPFMRLFLANGVGHLLEVIPIKLDGAGASLKGGKRSSDHDGILTISTANLSSRHRSAGRDTAKKDGGMLELGAGLGSTAELGE